MTWLHYTISSSISYNKAPEALQAFQEEIRNNSDANNLFIGPIRKVRQGFPGHLDYSSGDLFLYIFTPIKIPEVKSQYSFELITNRSPRHPDRETEISWLGGPAKKGTVIFEIPTQFRTGWMERNVRKTQVRDTHDRLDELCVPYELEVCDVKFNKARTTGKQYDSLTAKVYGNVEDLVAFISREKPESTYQDKNHRFRF